MKKQRLLLPILILATILITLCIGCVTVNADNGEFHELLPYMHTTDSKLKSATAGGHEYGNTYSSVPTASLHLNEDGGYTRAEYIYTEADGGRVYIEYYDKDFNRVSDKIKAIKVKQPEFGGIYYGEKYNYIFSGNGLRGQPDYYDPANPVIGKWALQQFDKNWDPVNSMVFEDSLVQNAIYASFPSFTEVGDTLYIHASYRMPFGDDGVAHQICVVLTADQNTLEMEHTDDHKWAGHSMNQFAINDGRYLYYLDHGDGYPRAFQIDRRPAEGSSELRYTVFNQFLGEDGLNYTGAHVGGFDFAGDRIITVTNTVDQSYGQTRQSVQKNIVVYSHSKDITVEGTEYKEVYLTNYPNCSNSREESYIEVGNPFLVRTDTKYSYVLWKEVRNADDLSTVRIAKIDKYGKLIGDVHSIIGQLSSHDPLYVDGSIVWYTTGAEGVLRNEAPVFYKINLKKLNAGEYDVFERVDLADLDIKLESYDVPYHSTNPPTPKLLPIVYKGYTLKEGLDYTVTYSNNTKLGTATATITGTGQVLKGDGLGIFGNSAQINYKIHTHNISDWKLVLNPEKAVFHPLNANQLPKWTVYNDLGKALNGPSGTFAHTSGTGNLWAAGTNTYSFTTSQYGYKGTISKDFVIKPYPASKLEVSLTQSTFDYTGKAIKPTVSVKYVESTSPLVVKETQDRSGKIYTNYKVTYSNNIEPGTGKVTIKFQGNYSGTITKTFTIKDVPKHTCNYSTTVLTWKASMFNDGFFRKKCSCGKMTEIPISKISSISLSETKYYYDGTILRPTVIVVDSAGKVLKKGTDYTVSYPTDCKSVKSNHYLRVEGTGNYSFSKTLYFSIVKPSGTIPKTPSGVKAVSASYNSIKVTWNKSTGATGYAVYRSSSVNGKYSLVTSTTKTSLTNSKLTTGKTYYYKVRAYKTVNGSKKYGNYSSIVSAAPLPAKPAGVKAASAGYNSVKISWNKAAGATGYTVYRSTSKSGSYKAIKSTTSLSYTNSSLTAGKTYYYKVRAYKTVNGTKKYSSYYSSVVSAKPVPAKPTSVKAASAGYNSIKVSWNKVTGATGYAVYRATSKTGTYTRLGFTKNLSYTNTGRTAGKTYYYKVKAYRTVSGEKKYSSYSSVVSAKPVPATPTLTAKNAGSKKIALSWNKISGASGYEVYRATSKSGSYNRVKTVTSGSTVSYTNSSLTTGKTYYYKVRAYRTVSGKKVYGSFSSIKYAKG